MHPSVPIRTLALWAAAGLALPLSAQSITRAAGQEGLARLEAAFPGTSARISPRFDPQSGAFAGLVGRLRVRPAGLGEAELPAAALAVARAAEGLTGVPAADLHAAWSGRTGSLLVQTLEERLDGIPVEDSLVHLTFGTDGDLMVLSVRGLVHRPDRLPPFQLGPDDAAELARMAPPQTSWSAFASEPTRVYLQDGDDLRSAWRLRVFDAALIDASWTVYVDALSGEAFRVVSDLLDADLSGAVDGRGHATGNHQTGGPPTVGPMKNLTITATRSVDPSLVEIGEDDPCVQEGVAVSDDGSTLVYTDACSGVAQVFVNPTSGESPTQLTFDSGTKSQLTIDAAGTLVLFVSDASGSDEVWKVGTDGSGLTRLTFFGATCARPRLDDAGDLFVFECNDDGDFEVYTMATDGTGLAKRTDNTVFDGDADLSGDGGTIAFLSTRSGPDRDLFVMNADGSGTTQLTFNLVDEEHPRTNDSGTRIVFTSPMGSTYGDPDGDAAGVGRHGGAGRLADRLRVDRKGIFSIESDGSGLERHTDDAAFARDADLTSDGSTLAYATRLRVADLWRVELKHLPTGTVLEVTDGIEHATHPVLADGPLGLAWDVEAPDRWVAFTALASSSLVTHTDETGLYAFEGLADGDHLSIAARLTGRFAKVDDRHPGQGNLRVFASGTAPMTGVDMHFNPSGANELRTTQVTAYRHTDAAHAKLYSVLSKPSFGLFLPLPIDRPLLARVNDPTGERNAYYNRERDWTTYFVSAGSGAPNTAYDTVVYHEYGHFADDMFGGIVSGSSCEANGSLSEALGDIAAMSTAGTRGIGKDWAGPGTFLRDYDLPVFLGGSGTRQYDCKECIRVGGLPEVHQHGEAFAGFYADFADMVGRAIADEVLFAAWSTNPPDMNSTVLASFLRDADPALMFGGTGDPAFAPHYDELCIAAAAHGFDCWPRFDFGSDLCARGACDGGADCIHTVVGTEWLGATVSVLDTGCEGDMSPEEDGCSFPMDWVEGELVPVAVTVSADPALLFSERWEDPGLHGGMPDNPLRYAYLNAWLYFDTGSGLSAPFHVLGTGSSSGSGGPIPFPGNTIAFSPELFDGSSDTFLFAIEVPETGIPGMRPAWVRFRLDYGEDAGRLTPMNCLSNPLLAGPCGPARFGEVEDYQIRLFPD